jgi:hypothetical protein
MMNRRTFFSFGTLLAAPGMIGAANTIEKKKENTSKLAPEKYALGMSLIGSYDGKNSISSRPIEKQLLKGSSRFILVAERPITNQVNMAVGKDNRLWIKVGEDWKRVAIES